MPSLTAREGDRGPFVLGGADIEGVGGGREPAVARARRSGQPTLATLTVALGEDVDPSAVVCASRREGEPWFLFEQSERSQAALATLGEATCLTAAGDGRFAPVFA